MNNFGVYFDWEYPVARSKGAFFFNNLQSFGFWQTYWRSTRMFGARPSRDSSTSY